MSSTAGSISPLTLRSGRPRHQSRTAGFRTDIRHGGKAIAVTSPAPRSGRTLTDVSAESGRARQGRQWAAIFGGGYLIFLVQPLWTEVTSGRPLTAVLPVVGAVALFVTLNMWFWIRVSYSERSSEGIVLVCALCAIAVALTLHDSNW